LVIDDSDAQIATGVHSKLLLESGFRVIIFGLNFRRTIVRPMTAKLVSILWVIGGLSFAGFAQAAPPAAASSSAQPAAVAVPFIVLRGALNKGLNSKSATVGQTFVVKTAEPLKLTNGTVIPAQSDVAGHVLQATARASGAPESTLTLTFDTLTPKGSDKPVAIRGIIQAITGPAPASVPAPVVGDMSRESVGGGATGARISSDQLHGDGSVGGGGTELNERSTGTVGLKGITLTAAPVNGVDGSMFYSADKSVKLENGSRVMLRIALKQ